MKNRLYIIDKKNKMHQLGVERRVFTKKENADFKKTNIQKYG